jgi:hypothetical protein
MPTTIDLVAGVFWTATYLLIVKRAYQDKAPGMPALALCSNFAWEILALTLRPVPEITPGAVMWVPPDAVMFCQCLLYGKSDFQDPFVKKYFRPIFVTTFVYALAFTYFFEVRLHDDTRYYSAYIGNLVMSALFIAMLLRRGSSRGQSMYIAVCKLLGTFIVSVEALRLHRDPQPALLVLLVAGILVLDSLYAVMLHRKLLDEGITPWRRL